MTRSSSLVRGEPASAVACGNRGWSVRLVLLRPAHYCGEVRAQLRIRVTAMVWMARFRARSPPRLRRRRTVRPLLASSGLVPARAANAASLRLRPGCEKLTGDIPGRA